MKYTYTHTHTHTHYNLARRPVFGTQDILIETSEHVRSFQPLPNFVQIWQFKVWIVASAVRQWTKNNKKLQSLRSRLHLA